MKNLKLGVSLFMAASALVACGDKSTSKFPGYDKVEETMFVKKVVENQEGREVTAGDIVTVNMQYSVNNDTVIFNSADSPQPVQLRADTGMYEGDLVGAFLGMRVGDSSSIIVSADSFFLKTARMPQLPEFIDSASMLYFNIGVVKVESLQELQSAAEAESKKAEMEEMSNLQAYISENDIQATPTASGLIFISKKEGTGKQAEAGKKVKVHYEGKLLNGTYFDTSVEEVAKANGLYDERRGYTPFEFTLGQGQVIRGWDEGIAMLKEGGKATLIIPSSIAYGASARPTIPAFSTLVFDVELIEVLDAE